MPVQKVLARDWKVEVKDDSSTWQEVGGVVTLGFGGSKTAADTTDFDSDGWEEHLVSRRGRSLTLEGHYLEDPDTGDRDPGQEAIDDLANAMGAEAVGDFKLTSPGGKVMTFSGSVEPADVGGGDADVTSWGATITVDGEVS